MSRPKKHPELIYARNKHCCYLLQYHLVLVTKYRHPVITGDIENRLFEIVEYLINKAGCQLIEVNADKDHIHILFSATPQTNISTLVNNIKTVTSRRIRQEFADVLSTYYWKSYFWSDTYFIGSVSETTTVAVQQYIKMQKEK